MAWGGDGDCVLSVSADQTARVFTAVPLPHASSSSAGSSARSALLPSGGAGRGEPGGGGAARAHWCEVARPQVRGRFSRRPERGAGCAGAGHSRNSLSWAALAASRRAFAVPPTLLWPRRRAGTQVHGHDFSCAAVLPRGTAAATYAYVSGSEEKVLRVMEGTQVSRLASCLGQVPARLTH